MSSYCQKAMATKGNIYTKIGMSFYCPKAMATKENIYIRQGTRQWSSLVAKFFLELTTLICPNYPPKIFFGYK